MAAARAALTTCELLEGIIVHLPANTIWKSRVVSKTWYKLIKTSGRARRAQRLVPLKQEDDFKDSYNKDRLVIPIYNPSDWAPIRVHPLLTPGSYSHTQDICKRTRLHTDECDWSQLQKRGAEFFTSPPCQAVLLLCLVRPVPTFERNESFVYRKEGVRICDVLDVTRLVIRQQAEDAGFKEGLFLGDIDFGEIY